MNPWINVANEYPKDGDKVEWIPPSGGDAVQGTKGPGRLWFLPDGTYVYYEPNYWRRWFHY